MATFGGNLGFKVALDFNSRHFCPTLSLIQVCEISSITCCRCYESSSGPVRFIPNSKSSGFRANVDYFEMENAVDYENEETFDEVEMAYEDGHGEGHVKKSSKDRLEAERIVIEALAARAYTAAELQKKLHGKRFSSVLINEVITDLQQRGLINDYLYAETFSQSRWSTSTWGPRRIKQALQRKGVHEADAVRATKHVFEGVDSGGDTEQRFGMSESSMDHLFAQAFKQWLRGQNVTHEKRKSRIIRWLQYRGFDWGVTSFILKKLESQYPQ
ncbi:hypothetical protein Syun_010632 [Stephania yunnanensis]|uniref:Regulatory protein RecX n=1 Tax=Stephania yunnanensis TaxID=152371 RepID=A0AAP0KGV0_9MAGN